MCSLSGYDSEAVGFLSDNQRKKETPDGETQTSLYSSMSTGSQTSFYTTIEAQTTANQTDDSLLQNMTAEYPAGLSEFLKRVAPSILEALDDNTNEYNQNGNPGDTVVETERTQKIEQLVDKESTIAAGDQSHKAVLCMAWSCGGNTLAISYGQHFHEDWCEHGGLIKVYSVLKSKDDDLCNVCDIQDANCVTALEYHPNVPGLLAYGTAGGDVVVKDMRNESKEEITNEIKVTSNEHHSCKRVSYIMWADKELTSKLLWLSVSGTTKKRDANDLVLITSGFDGNVVIWQVNPITNILVKITGYCINGSQLNKHVIPDISCFDFNHNDCFVVGSKTGQLISCRTNITVPIQDSDNFDPAVQIFETNGFSLLKVMFKSVHPYIFASLTSNSEISIYKLNLAAPLKVICVEGVTTCMEWVPKSPNILLLGVSNDFQEQKMLKLYDVISERDLELKGTEGDKGDLTVTTMAMNKNFNDRVALGTSSGSAYIWKIPLSQFAVSKMDGFELYCD